MSRLLERAEALRPELLAKSDEIERGRRLPPDLARTLAASGFFRMLVPASVGGGEVAPAEMVRVLSALALGDSAAAWCVMTGATTGLCAAYLPPEGLEEIGSDDGAIYAGVFAPTAKAVREKDGYRVTGRWAFASGCENATWRLGGALVEQPDGRPGHMAFFFSAEQTEIHDTWDVAGLRGTGSHDLSVDDAFVPAHRTCRIIDAAPSAGGSLYAFPVFGLLAAGVAAVAIGVAQSALSSSVEEARPERRKREAFQAGVAEAEGELSAGRAFLLEVLEETYTRVGSAEAMSLKDRARLRIAATQAVRASARSVDTLYEIGGGAAIYRRSPLQRHFRDIHTLTQHIMVAAGSRVLAGRALLDIPGSYGQL